MSTRTIWPEWYPVGFLSGHRRDLIGWQISPFQFEVGVADLAIGATAVVSFWCSLPFKAAGVCTASIFLLGDAVGHLHQMLEAGNFAPGNAGVPFFMDVICPMLSIVLLAAAWRHYRAGLFLRRSVGNDATRIRPADSLRNVGARRSWLGTRHRTRYC
jgi:hypothetical protein